MVRIPRGEINSAVTTENAIGQIYMSAFGATWNDFSSTLVAESTTTRVIISATVTLHEENLPIHLNMHSVKPRFNLCQSFKEMKRSW